MLLAVNAFQSWSKHYNRKRTTATNQWNLLTRYPPQIYIYRTYILTLDTYR